MHTTWELLRVGSYIFKNLGAQFDDRVYIHESLSVI